jgi:zinc transport system substrate-binding protein
MSRVLTFKHSLAFVWLLFLSAITPAFAQTDVKVLASIKPLALIAQTVIGDRGSVAVLLPVAASPHDYPLKVSDMHRLREADIVLWVGPELEAFLQRPLTSTAPTKQLSAYHLAGLHWPSEELQERLGAPEHNHGDDHHHHDQDPHLWLDPRNGIVIARALAARLAQINPSSAEFYSANAERFAQEIIALDQQLVERLAVISAQGFAVYHEGYLHFVGRYQLRQLGFVTYTPERRPGARHLYQLRKELKEKATCLFTEPYYDQRSARELADELGLRVGVLDPIGGEHISTYRELINAMAGDFLACLAEV